MGRSASSASLAQKAVLSWKPVIVRDFLQRHSRVEFHFTPTYASWLNQVEIWFAKIEREVMAHGIFTSVPDLAGKLRRYINAYSAIAQPIQWKYSDSARRPTYKRIQCDSPLGARAGSFEPYI